MAGQLAWSLFLLFLVPAIAVCAATWAWVVRQWRRGRPVPPYQPRRPVPWHGADLALIVAIYLALQVGLIGLADKFWGPGPPEAAVGQETEESTTAEHAVSQLIQKGGPWALLLTGLSAVVVAPLVEEFFFRVLLQGWLEAVEHRLRRRLPTLRRLVPRGVVPILLASLLFARLHFRVGEPKMGVRVLVFQQATMVLSGLLALALAVGLLRWRTGATAADLGWTPGKLRGDVKLGLAAMLAVVLPVYALQIKLQSVLPSNIAPDPLPLFFFALALGALYYRTHRIAPLVVLHAGLNGSSLMLAWLLKQWSAM